ncbi:hypothetical protein ACI1T3_02135 [Lactococcus petauri]|uniref:hypothetical protein n=1 Tax=Lactococcus petauri TaxID=1940789 RepID=UPI0038532C04
MKLGKYNLTTFRRNNVVLLVCNWEEKQTQAIVSKFIYFTENTERKPLVITKEIANRCRIKQEIRQANKIGNSPQGLHLLAELVEKDIQKSFHNKLWEEWYRYFAYETIYGLAFDRGIRHERQRRKQCDNIGALTGNDMNELSEALGISENKVVSACLELSAKRKGGY